MTISALSLRLFFLFLMVTLSNVTLSQSQGNPFNVTVFYSGTWDAAHISFVNESKVWFPKIATENNFKVSMTNNWGLLNDQYLAQQQVVVFLDGAPGAASERQAFEKYMKNGGAWLGFHVSAFNTAPSAWDWYYNQFLGTGAFRSNTWGATSAILKIDTPDHPVTKNMPATFRSAVSEWYSWNNNLRNNTNIRILASIDNSSFPVGTDPNQTWYSGDYPIVWTHKNYRMVYMNMGHNDMDYARNLPLSSTFASDIQNRMIINTLLWLGGRTTTEPLAHTIPGRFCAVDVTLQAGTQSEPTSLTGCNNNVGWIDTGDWLEYRVNVAETATYKVKVNVASLAGGGQLQFLNSTKNIVAVADVPQTYGWQTWEPIELTINLTKGEQALRVVASAGGFNLHSFELQKSEPPVKPIVIEAESYTHMLGIQTETCSDTGGGLNVGWIDTNDWLSYASVNIPKSGYYEVRFRVASASGSGVLQFERSGGTQIYGSTSIPNTGGWQKWQTVTQVVYLEAGAQGFGIKALSGGFNINWLSITPRI